MAAATEGPGRWRQGAGTGGDGEKLTVFSLFSLSSLSLPPSIASVDVPEARLLEPSFSSDRRLRLNDVFVVRVDGSNGAVEKGARNGVAEEDDVEEEEEDENEKDGGAEEDEAEGAEDEDVDVANDCAKDEGAYDEEEEDEDENSAGTDKEGSDGDEANAIAEPLKAGTGGFGSGTLASLASIRPSRALIGSSKRNALDAAGSARFFVTSSSMPPWALTAGSARDLSGVVALPPAPPNSFREGSKRPRSDGREPGAEDDAEEGRAREEMMGDGEGICRRFCESRGVRSSDARMRCAVCDDDIGYGAGVGVPASGRCERGPSIIAPLTVCGRFHRNGCTDVAVDGGANGLLGTVSEPGGLSPLPLFLAASAARGVAMGAGAARGLGALTSNAPWDDGK